MTIPPLHPIFVHLPLALIPLSVAADWIGLVRNKPLALLFGRFSLLLAWVAMLPTMFFGYFDYGRLFESEPVFSLLRLHFKLGWTLFVCLTALGVWRARINFVAASRVGSHAGYLSCAALVFGLTVFQGWYGGELVYGAGTAVYAPEKKRAPYADRPETIYRVHEIFSHVPVFRDPPPPVPAVGRPESSDAAPKK